MEANMSKTGYLDQQVRERILQAGVGIHDCPNCGGTHFGSTECPFLSAPCVVCGYATIIACSDCAIDTSKSVHVCAKPECQERHEATHAAA